MKSAGAIQEKGVKYTFRLESREDFQRQVVRGDNGNFRIEELDLLMPPAAGQLTNMESLFNKILIDLSAEQPTRKETNPDLYTAIETIVARLTKLLECEAFPITVSLDDMTGNSFIEPSPSDKGSKYGRQEYFRTREQNIELGLAEPIDETNGEDDQKDPLEGVNIVAGEVYELPAECPVCAQSCTVNMKQVNIPHFKEVIIMATVCDHCGYRTSDVKTGGEIPLKGKRITLKAQTKEDLSRDILKSETCTLHSPELGLEVQSGTLGGRFTTVEGLITQVRDQLRGQVFDTDDPTFAAGAETIKAGDSMATTEKAKWNEFFAKIEDALNNKFPFTIVLEDPLANSFVQLTDDDKDTQVVEEEYDRTEEEEEDLGLKDMNVEGYAEESDDVPPDNGAISNDT